MYPCVKNLYSPPDHLRFPKRNYLKKFNKIIREINIYLKYMYPRKNGVAFYSIF
jgi:hypothetical protein